MPVTMVDQRPIQKNPGGAAMTKEEVKQHGNLRVWDGCWGHPCGTKLRRWWHGANGQGEGTGSTPSTPGGTALSARVGLPYSQVGLLRSQGGTAQQPSGTALQPGWDCPTATQLPWQNDDYNETRVARFHSLFVVVASHSPARQSGVKETFK